MNRLTQIPSWGEMEKRLSAKVFSTTDLILAIYHLTGRLTRELYLQGRGHFSREQWSRLPRSASRARVHGDVAPELASYAEMSSRAGLMRTNMGEE